MSNLAILIPAYNPGDHLLSLVESLLKCNFSKIVIVDDGSDPSSQKIFAKLAQIKNCYVVHHAVNLGKGRALKTGFNFCCLNFPDILGVLTADCDGQHLPHDIRKVADAFRNNPNMLVIGCRTFNKKSPLKSRFGNILTRYVFKLLIGEKLSDTQSGLRCIPIKMIPILLSLKGEHYEYEMNMLIAPERKQFGIREVPIDTVYLDGNRLSHFNPLIDSMRIYFLLLRFAFSSIFASSIDFIIFTAIFLINKNFSIAFIVARLVAGCVNFFINRNLVFHSMRKRFFPFVKYLILFVTLAALSFFSIRILIDYKINVIEAKILIETILFFISFMIQRDFVFNRSFCKME